MAIVESALAQVPEGRRGNSLADILDLILDKGMVIDAFVRVSVIGIELLTLDARIVIASIDTYLGFARAVNRLDLTKTKESTTYEDLVRGSSSQISEGGTKGVIEGVKDEMPGHKKKKESGAETDPGGDPPTESGTSGSDQEGGDEEEDEGGEDEGADDDGDDDDGDGDDRGGKGPFGRLAHRARYG